MKIEVRYVRGGARYVRGGGWYVRGGVRYVGMRLPRCRGCRERVGGERGMKGIFGKSPACSARRSLHSAEVAGPLFFAEIPKPPTMNLP